MKKRDLALALAAIFPGLSAVTCASAIIAYQAMFPRYERPNYSIVLGEYEYGRIAPRLPRREIFYTPHENKLHGYFYGDGVGRGTVILRHGIRAGADDYLPMIEYLVRRGYSVFTYDATGTYESGGDSTVGMCQAIIDLEATVDYLRKAGVLSGAPLYLLGHSWGAYAITAGLCVIDGINACAAISGMNNGSTFIADKAREYVKVGGIVALPDRVFRMYQKLLFGRYIGNSAVSGIKRSGIPTLIAHGVGDKVIKINNGSIISYADELRGLPVSYYVGKGLRGAHDSIWHSEKATAYLMEIDSELELIRMKKGDSFTAEDVIRLYSTCDHRVASEVNEELMEKIIETFESAK